MMPFRSYMVATGLLAASLASAGAHAAPPPAGTILAQQAIDGAPDGATAYRLKYASRGQNGDAVSVSGLVIVPAGTAPSGGRPVVAWAHPTTGVVPACAPSRSFLKFAMIPGLRDMLKQGFVVTATDYPGTGPGEVQPFLDGRAEARAVLDSVRAARRLEGSGAGQRYALWGHSQGGQAVLFAGAMHKDYAPELALAGVAAAAPATDLAALLRDDMGTKGGNNLTSLALWSWARTQDAPFDAIVRPGAVGAIDAVAAKCIDALLPSPSKRAADKVLAQGFLTVPDVTAVAPWREIIARNSAEPLPATVPLFLAQGDADVIVRPAVTAAFMARQCAAGGKVALHVGPNIGHGWIATKSANAAIGWIADRFAELPAPDDCGARQVQSLNGKNPS
ncbi:alpha/beta fold hydrolase [Polymorphobacter fuscus]|uniref:Alpha/beta fold hydrolase n=1 Tax=Sandarakinorhabdus fusca TaxID=1439888 RepID=A0A7C9GUK4_9SPHN|nr:alpha/beta fold hydrolase [Polymorphobacter fuscus]KAB7647706.1 alpha/beta fold hydrolase [Polymorphobacter fuscus]MQT16998.1 alpha/beta fold hydrolase [Polymorphobacter fuscus]NJC09011.1 pimeloyl-ACP methyl ester carboxylesterase [Polymorphobacter fuscus]